MFFIVERKTLSCVCLWTPPLPCLRKTTPVAYKQEHIPEFITKKYDLRVVFFLCIPNIILYFGTPLPLRGGFPPKVRSRPAGCMQVSLFFCIPLPSSLPIIACLRVCGIACAIRMVSKASYNRGVHSALQKKCSITCIHAIFVVSLHSICYSIRIAR